MYTVHVVAVEDGEKSHVDYWMNFFTAKRIRDEERALGKTAYFFTVLVNTVIGLEARLMLSAKDWSQFDSSRDPIPLRVDFPS